MAKRCDVRDMSDFGPKRPHAPERPRTLKKKFLEFGKKVYSTSCGSSAGMGSTFLHPTSEHAACSIQK